MLVLSLSLEEPFSPALSQSPPALVAAAPAGFGGGDAIFQVMEPTDIPQMVEVFKTDVKDEGQAKKLVNLIHGSFPGYKANFDLEDRDRILRVQCDGGFVQPSRLIALLKVSGFHAEVLDDDL
jgi:hypothetical protein